VRIWRTKNFWGFNPLSDFARNLWLIRGLLISFYDVDDFNVLNVASSEKRGLLARSAPGG
jgi:hypothetical protein